MIPAGHYRRGRLGAVDLLVLHTAEGARTVEALARYFATTDRRVSAHAGADDEHLVELLPYTATAFAAPGANADGEHLELCGFAAWSRDEWRRHPGMLEQAARWIAARARARGLPIVALGPAELRADRRGVTTHAAVSAAFRRSSHTDPGAAFPLDDVLDRARQLATSAPTPALTGRSGAKATRGAPPWPFGADHYLGTTRRDRRCHSGAAGGADAAAVATWQRRMRQRGWTLAVDGRFGPRSEAVARAFAREKQLGSAGVVGPAAWSAAWLEPISR